MARRNSRFTDFWIFFGLFAGIALLEYSTPPDYVFSYLYIGPILLASSRLSRSTTFWLTLTAAVLAMLNTWIPGKFVSEPSTVASRMITVLAIVVTGLLSDRNRIYQSELAQKQAKLNAQEKLAQLREDFASTLSHDLRTPLLGGIETLKAFLNGQFGEVQPVQHTVLTTMIRSHQTSLQLVETLLDVYRNDTQGLQLKLAPANLVTIAEEVAASVFDLAHSRRVHLSFNYGESDFRKYLWVSGDALQLKRVFANLLTNAINHTPRGGKIEVVLEAHPSYQIAKVIDTGSGFTPEELPYLFDRFYQGHSDRQIKGSGLGLYLTRQIIEAHGGRIWAGNHPPQGAVLGFRLPALPFQSPF